MNQERKKKRPNVITILSILMMMGGTLGFINMVLIILQNISSNSYSILVLGLLSTIAITLGIGNYKGLKWAWCGTIIFYGICICLGIGQVIISSNPAEAFGNNIIGIIFLIAIIYEYNRPSQKEWFNMIV